MKSSYLALLNTTDVAKDTVATVAATTSATLTANMATSEIFTPLVSLYLAEFLSDYFLPGMTGLLGAIAVQLYTSTPIKVLSKGAMIANLFVAAVLAGLVSSIFSGMVASWFSIPEIKALAGVGIVAGVVMPKVIKWLWEDATLMLKTIFRVFLGGGRGRHEHPHHRETEDAEKQRRSTERRQIPDSKV